MGWFVTWFGMDHIFSVPNKNNSELEFYRKMSKSEIKFYGY
jgi:hypothetical protein